MKKIQSQIKKERRVRRQHRIRSKIFGTKERPRLSIFKSNTAIYAQIIDDEKGTTLAAASTRDIKTKGKGVVIAAEVGKMLAKKAIEKNIKKVTFDRGGFFFTGKVKAVATGARDGGLEF